MLFDWLFFIYWYMYCLFVLKVDRPFLDLDP